MELERLGFQKGIGNVWEKYINTSSTEGKICVRDWGDGRCLIHIYSGLGMEEDYAFTTSYSYSKLKRILGVLGE